jgi:polyisoprenoid-binding protein YceI
MKHILFVLTLATMIFSCKNKEVQSVTASEASTASTPVGSGTKYVASPATSDIRWIGSSPGGSHNGSLKILDGQIYFDSGSFTGGKFTINMKSINVQDLEGDEKNSLESHLKGTGDKAEADHFFNINEYPTATFEVVEIVGASDQKNSNSTVTGNLTMRGITKMITFAANISIGEDDLVISTIPFTINRTDWGIKYSSKTFIDNLKDDFIDDNITMQISLLLKKEGSK